MSDRLGTPRIKLILPTLCWGKFRGDFYAVTADLSSVGITFRSAVIPARGEHLTCSIRHTGALEAEVVHAGKGRFGVRVLRAEYPLRLIVQNLVALAAEQNAVPVRQRAHPRIVPDAPDVLVTTLCGRSIPGRLIDISVSGAALTIDVPLEPGALITIGRTPAKVARRFEGGGIGAAFLTPLPDADLGPHVVL